MFRPDEQPAPAPQRQQRRPKRIAPEVPASVETNDVRSSNPLKDLPPFKLQPRPDAAVQDLRETDAPVITQGQIMWENVKFFCKTFGPYAIVVGLLIGGFIFRKPLLEKLTKIHTALVAEMQPEVETLESDESVIEEITSDPGVIDNVVADEEPASSNEPPVDPSKISAKGVDLALQANVKIEVEGLGSGTGIIFNKAGGEALVLTSLSLIDQGFWITGGHGNLNELPEVELEYSDARTVMGEVVWIAAGDADLALVRAPCPSANLSAVSYQPETVRTGDTVFYIASPGELTEHVARTIVTDVAVGSSDVPIVTVDAKQLVVGSGLYNAAGALIAVSGSGEVLPDTPAKAVPVSPLLRNVELLSLLSNETSVLTP